MPTQTVSPDELETIDTEVYPFVMSAEDNIVASTTITELVAALPGIDPGYLDLDDEAALYARYDHAVAAAREAQDQQASDSDDFNPGKASEEVLTMLFAVPKSTPLAGLHAWNELVPLVLIATDYAPYTEQLAPSGNVKFINPADERSFLDTLMDVGLINLVVAG